MKDYDYAFIDRDFNEIETWMETHYPKKPTKDWEPEDFNTKIYWSLEINRIGWWRQIDTGSGWEDVEFFDIGDIRLSIFNSTEEMHQDIMTNLKPDRVFSNDYVKRLPSY